MSALIATLPHRKFTVEEYHFFIEQGVFKPEERLELIEGELIEMSPTGKKRASCVDGLVEFFVEISKRSFIVRSQNPIVLDDFSEPQPDVCLLKRREDFYRQTAAKDAWLVIEVAETTAKYDRERKFPRYAANGIGEAWLIDLENDRVEIHSEPTAFGYSLVKIFHRGQTAQSTILPQIEISVAEILG